MKSIARVLCIFIGSLLCLPCYATLPNLLRNGMRQTSPPFFLRFYTHPLKRNFLDEIPQRQSYRRAPICSGKRAFSEEKDSQEANKHPMMMESKLLTLFGDPKHKRITLHFLNNILKPRPGEQLTALGAISTNSTQYLESSDFFIDLFCGNAQKQRVFISINGQYLTDDVREKPLQSFTAKTLSRQLAQGDYGQPHKTIFLSLTPRKLFPHIEESVTYHELRERSTLYGHFPDMSWAFVELGKREISQNRFRSPQEEWLYLLRNAHTLDPLEKFSTQEVQEAYEILSESESHPEV